MLKEYNVFGDVNRSSAVQSRSSFSVDWHTHEKAGFPFCISGRREKREAAKKY